MFNEPVFCMSRFPDHADLQSGARRTSFNLIAGPSLEDLDRIKVYYYRTHIVTQSVIELGEDLIGISYSVASNNLKIPLTSHRVKTGLRYRESYLKTQTLLE